MEDRLGGAGLKTGTASSALPTAPMNRTLTGHKGPRGALQVASLWWATPIEGAIPRPRFGEDQLGGKHSHQLRPHKMWGFKPRAAEIHAPSPVESLFVLCYNGSPFFPGSAGYQEL